jgi:imidazolonepropionase-like amidohydrolase
MGIDDRVGTIAPGKQADLILVSGDPLDFAAYPGNIRAVYRKGRLVRSY